MYVKVMEGVMKSVNPVSQSRVYLSNSRQQFGSLDKIWIYINMYIISVNMPFIFNHICLLWSFGRESIDSSIKVAHDNNQLRPYYTTETISSSQLFLELQAQ